MTHSETTNIEIPTRDNQVSVTERASHKILELMKQEGAEGKALRIQAVPGGCSGMSYHFDFEDKPNADDAVFTQHGLRVFIDKESQSQITGSTIDYVESTAESGFKINNPNVQKHGCGCGKNACE